MPPQWLHLFFILGKVKAIWNGQVVAESDDIVTVDDYHYFPRSAMKADFFRESDRTSECHCKGIARYWDLEVNGQTCVTPVWSYESPTKAFDKIKMRIAFFPNQVELIAD